MEGTNQMPERDYYQMKSQEVLGALNTSQKGLARDEAEKRRTKYGPNEIRADVSVPKWLLFLSQFKEVLVLVLIVAGIISIVIGVLDNSFDNLIKVQIDEEVRQLWFYRRLILGCLE